MASVAPHLLQPTGISSVEHVATWAWAKAFETHGIPILQTAFVDLVDVLVPPGSKWGIKNDLLELSNCVWAPTMVVNPQNSRLSTSVQ